MVGKKLGRYDVVGLLGRGGMGDVYLAEDTELGRRVAIKVLPAELADDPERLARLRREARILASIDHPNVNAVYNLEKADGVHFLVLQLVEGETLAERLGRGPLPAGDALEIASQVAAALAEAHAKGIVHRDLKPSNVMLTPGGGVKVLDFGIARIDPARDAVIDEEPTELLLLTGTGVVLGTAPYMSPEQIRNAPIDARTDVWAFGCLLFEMLSGSAPFRRASVGDTVAAVLEHEPDWSELPGALDPLVGDLLRRCLAKVVEHRPASVGEARAALLSAGASSDGTDASASPATASRAPARRATGSAVAVLGTVAVVAVVVLWATGTLVGSGGSFELGGHRLLTDFPGSQTEPTVSPDGSLMAFVTDASGGLQLWVKPVGPGEPRQITDLEGPLRSPSWSPRGDQIVFERAGRGIWTVGALGSPVPRQIVEQGRNPALSADGSLMVYELGLGIWIAGADGSDPRRLDNVPTRTLAGVPAQPALSPDAGWVVAFIQEAGPTGDFWLIPVDGGDPRRLTRDHVEGGTPAFSPDGHDVIFSSKRGGSLTLWSVPVDGGEPVAVTSGTGEDANPVFSPDGSVLVYTNVRNHRALMITDPETGDSRQILEQRYGILMPEVSPSGDRIAFFGEVDGGADVFVINGDGTGLRSVTAGEDGFKVLPTWLADGSGLLYYQLSGATSLRRIDTAGGRPVVLFEDFHPDTHQSAVLHPSGRWVAWSRIIAPFDEDTTFLRDVDSGVDMPLAAPPERDSPGPFHLHTMEWSADGSRLVGWAHPDEIWICRPDIDCRMVGRGARPRWGPGESSIYVRRTADAVDMRTVWRIDLRDSTEVRLVEYGPVTPIENGFDLLPDGRIVWAQQRDGDYEIWVADVRR